MKSISIVFLTLLFSLSIAHAEEAPDAAHGKELHDKNCAGCHVNMIGGDGSMLYTRRKSRVTSLEKLEAQVRRCETNLQLKWFDSDILDVAEYLQNNFYKFPKN